MSRRALVAVLAALVVAGASSRQLRDDDFHFAQCSNQPVFNVSGVSINPNPAIHGQDVYVSLTGLNAREVTGATLTVTIYYRGWPVQRQTRDICSGDRPVVPPCPFEPGNLTITSSDSVPLIAPVGPYSMRMQAWDQGGAGVMCVDLWFRVVSAPSGAVSAQAGALPAPSGAAPAQAAAVPAQAGAMPAQAGAASAPSGAGAAVGSGGSGGGGGFSSGGGETVSLPAAAAAAAERSSGGWGDLGSSIRRQGKLIAERLMRWPGLGGAGRQF